MRIFTLLLFLTYASLSLALGLGEIELKSHLGEQLFVKVNVTDIETLPDPSCFTISDTSDVPAFKRANIELKQINGYFNLAIKTNEIITEPIVNLRISANCETSVNRDYVLLLDPASLDALGKDANNLTDQVKSQSLLSNQKNSEQNINNKIASSQKVSKSADFLSGKSSKKKKIPGINDKLMEAYTGKQKKIIANSINSITKSSASTDNIETRTSTQKPYLVISGSNASSDQNANKPSLSLRLETQIDFARTDTVTTPLTTVDSMDEATVMTNRLTHLEKQILSLQTRNTQLLTEAEKNKNKPFSLSAQQLHWLQILLIGAGIAAALTCVAWLRRKILLNRLDKKHSSWFETESNIPISDESTFSAENNIKNSEATIFDEPSFTQSFGQNSTKPFGITSSITVDEKSENESIMDNADVFIAHGRPALAIQLLQNYLVDFPAESPAIWLKLLNLLALEGPEDEYDAAVIECKQFFNIKMPKFSDAGIKDKSTIENYPHIITRLEGVWGSPFASTFLNDLIYNQQSQPREGFERGTFEELFFLKQIAEIQQSSYKSGANSGSYKPEVINPALEKVALNQAMFTNIEPLIDTEIASPVINSNTNQSITKNPNSNTKSSSYPDLPTYEIDNKLVANTPLDINKPLTDEELIKSKNNNVFDISEDFQAEEIDFQMPVEEIHFDSVPGFNSLDEEIVLGNSIPATQNNEYGIVQNLPKNKPKTKSKSKNQTETNIIEWDIPNPNKN